MPRHSGMTIITKMIRVMTMMTTIIVAPFALPMLPNATSMMMTKMMISDDYHDADDKDDDCDDDKDDGCHDNYHRSTLCITNAADVDCDDTIVVASSASPMQPNRK